MFPALYIYVTLKKNLTQKFNLWKFLDSAIHLLSILLQYIESDDIL